MKFQLWMLYVLIAGLAWGTYVPIIFYGGSALGKQSNARLMAILCVGLAYFIIAVIFPLVLFLTGQEEWPSFKTTGIVFSSLAGVSGAVGAICVVFASKAAVAAAVDDKLDPASYRMYIAPLIFGCAPVINTLISMVWHPKPDNPFHFELIMPGWKLYAGIILVGLGAALVLYSKEEVEQPAPKVASSPTARSSINP